MALKLGFGVLAELGTCFGEVGEDLLAAESGAATRGGDDGLAFVGVHEEGGFENLRLHFWLNDDETMRLEKAFYDSKKSLTGKVFISASSLEGKNLFEKRALNLANALKSRNYPGLTVKHHVFQDESHVSEIGALTGKILYFFYGLPVDRSLGKGHKADK